jgi:hypothetical protein
MMLSIDIIVMTVHDADQSRARYIKGPHSVSVR